MKPCFLVMVVNRVHEFLNNIDKRIHVIDDLIDISIKAIAVWVGQLSMGR